MENNLYQWELTNLDELLNLIGTKVLLVNMVDMLVRSHNKSARYNVRSFMLVSSTEAYSRKLNPAVVEFIRKSKSPPKAVALFLALEKFKTGILLYRMGVIPQNQAMCPFCLTEPFIALQLL